MKSDETSIPAKPVIINSNAELNSVVKAMETDLAATRQTQGRRMQEAFSQMMVQNFSATSMIRSELFRFLLDGPRDIDGECGYPAVITPDHYNAMYEREGIARRVVDCLPEESWQMDPEVYEDEDPETETEFEKEWTAFQKKHNVWYMLQRIDILSGIGQYGILLIGINDGKELYEPVEGFNDDGTVDEGNKYEVLYLRPFDETVLFVRSRQTDLNNPRYGLATMYTIQFRDFPYWGIQAGETISRDVHWSRVIHVADNLKKSVLFGTPRQQPVYNRLYDLRKTYSAAGEAYWKGGFPSLAFSLNPELADQGIPVDDKSMKEQMDRFQNGLQRYLAITGLDVKTLPPEVVDPTPHVEAQLKAIAVSMNIPYRIMFGSEGAKLTADPDPQDCRKWNKNLASRQTKYINPCLSRPFIDRIIDFGAVSRPKEYHIDWPDLNAPTDQDKAEVALTLTQAIQAYMQSGASQLVSPRDFLVFFVGKTAKEADAILKAAAEFAGSEGDENDDQFDEDNPDGDEEDDDTNEGSLGGSNPDNGDATNTPNLSRTTTVGKGKPVESQLVQMPSINEWSEAAREASIRTREENAKGEDRSGKRSQRAEVGELHPATKEGKGKDSTIKMSDGSDVPEHVKASMIPPAYRHNLKVSKDKNADVWAESEDEEGNKKRVYNPKFLESNQDIKWGRVREGVSKLHELRSQIHADRAAGRNSNEADAAWLMSEQATRPGSESDTKGNKKLWDEKISSKNVKVTPAKGKGEASVSLEVGGEKIPIRDAKAKAEIMRRVDKEESLENAGFWLKSHGATTLEGRHVIADNKGGASVQFMGKEGVWHDHKIQNPDLAKNLLNRKEKAGDRGSLFGTNYDKVSKYVGNLGEGSFSPKDLRTIRANEMAHQMIGEGKSVGSENEKDAFKRQVAEHVSKTLGNRPQQALESYIDPKVFDKVKVSDGRKKAA